MRSLQGGAAESLIRATEGGLEKLENSYFSNIKTICKVNTTYVIIRGVKRRPLNVLVCEVTTEPLKNGKQTKASGTDQQIAHLLNNSPRTLT